MHEMLDRKHTAMMLVVVFFATFMDGLDGSVVNVALPDIGASFNIDTATVSWTTIIYMMVLAGTLVAFARVAADNGVRKVMATGLLVFTLGSLICGLSPTFHVLIASRAIQAIGAGMMAAAAPMCCTEHLPAHKLGFGLSIVTIGASLGFAIGPALGGIIVDYTSWHWIFLVNVPLGLVVTPIILKAIPPHVSESGKTGLDIMGAALLFCAITLVTFAIETLSHSSMRIVSVLSLAAGLAVLCVFVKIESRTEKPLLKLSMFRDLGFSAIFVCLMLINMVFMGMLYLVPFYGQICLGMSSTVVGLFLLVSAVVTAIFGMPFAKWSDHAGRKGFCIAAGLLAAIGLGILALFTRNMSDPILLTAMVAMGLSWACVGGPMASRLVEHSGGERNMASSLTNEAYYVGGAVGTAICAVLFTAFSGTDGVDIKDVTSSVFEIGFEYTILFTAAVGLVIAVLSFAVRD